VVGDTRIRDAHIQAVKSVLEYIESSKMIYTRKTVNSKTHYERHNIICSLHHIAIWRAYVIGTPYYAAQSMPAYLALIMGFAVDGFSGINHFAAFYIL